MPHIKNCHLLFSVLSDEPAAERVHPVWRLQGGWEMPEGSGGSPFPPRVCLWGKPFFFHLKQNSPGFPLNHHKSRSIRSRTGGKNSSNWERNINWSLLNGIVPADDNHLITNILSWFKVCIFLFVPPIEECKDLLVVTKITGSYVLQ